MNDPSDPVDTISPWTIKAVPTATRIAATNAARKEALTVGQWLEKRVSDWEAAGGPVALSAPVPVINPGELAALMTAVRDLAQAAKDEVVPPHIARDGISVLKSTLRQARGLPPLAPRKPPQKQLAAPEANRIAARDPVQELS